MYGAETAAGAVDSRGSVPCATPGAPVLVTQRSAGGQTNIACRLLT